MESRARDTGGKKQKLFRDGNLYEYYMNGRISSHWPKVHYGMPTAKKKKVFLIR
jgi:hypothetical protein